MTISDKCNNACGDSSENIDFASDQETGDNTPNVECSFWKRGFRCGDTLAVTYAALNALFQDLYQRVCGIEGVDPCDSCCDAVAMTEGTSGGGVCVIVSSSADDMTYQSRDGTIIRGSGGILTQSNAGALEIEICNPFDCPAIVDLSVMGVGSAHFDPALFGDLSMVWVVSDTLAEQFPTVMDVGSHQQTTQTVDRAYILGSIPTTKGLHVETLYSGDVADLQGWNTTGSTDIRILLAANECKTYYGQWWYLVQDWVGTNANQLMHGQMYARWTVTKGGIVL